MRSRAHKYSLLAVLLSATLLDTADARPFRPNQIPNGWVNGCKNCHEEDGAGGPRNPFGLTIQNGFLSVPGSTGNVQWGPALAAIDSDGDGRTNGEELLDPGGTWAIGQAHPGNPDDVRLPGHVDEGPEPAAAPLLPPFGVAFAAFALGGIGVRVLRRKYRAS